MTLDARGCPTGLEPAAEAGGAADPEAFVRALPGGVKELSLLVRGARCGGCLAKIEAGVGAMKGVETARLNLTSGRMEVTWRGEDTQALDITRRISDLGYEASPYDPEAGQKAVDADERMLLRCLAVAGFATANIMMLLSIPVWFSAGEMGEATRALLHWFSALIALAASAYAGRPFFASAWRVLKVGRTNMDVPISLGVILALAVSIHETAVGGPHAYFDASVMLLFFLLIGRYLDHRLRARARGAAQDLLAMQAVTARRIDAAGNITAVKARDLRSGDRLLLAPGDRLPVDARVIEGASDVDRSIVSGESAAFAVGPGGALHAGVLNLTRRLIVEAVSRADQSLVAELARLIEAGAQTKARYVRLADQAASLYVPIVHTLALSTFIGWWWLMDAGVRVAVLNAVAVLIITCPCALGLAVPAVQVVATGRLFKRGILVKTGDALERLAQIDTVVFDKTGTLTMGRPELSGEAVRDAGLIETAAQLARASRHPLARAIADYAGPGRSAPDVEEIPGEGLRGTVGGEIVRLGRRRFADPENADPQPDARGAGLWIKIGARPVRHLQIEDRLRADAGDVVADLKARGLAVVMLSGDEAAPAERVARALAIDDWRSALTPAEKAQYLRRLAAEGRRVLMIGDGLNDAPSLALAHASMSPGSAADVSQAAADFVFQGEVLAPVIEALDVAKAARRRVMENFALAALYNILAIPVAVAGLVTPLIAAAAMSGSSILVTANALRLRGRK